MRSFLAFNPCWLSLDWYKNISQIWNLSGNPVQLHVHRKYLHCKIKLYSDKMPLSNPLAFLCPLYDIVVWQFLLMSGQKSERLITGQPDHVKFIFGMHKVVANFIWKLLEFQAYNHLKQNILETEAKQATGNWSFGEQATDKMIHWCQGQWQRKRPCLADTATPFADNEPMTVAWNTNIPVCSNCGIPCSNCMEELNENMLMEMSTARVWMSYEEFTNQRLEIILMMVTLLMKKTFQTTKWNSESGKHRSYECV